MIPTFVNITIPTWIWWAVLLVVIVVDIVWNVYRVQAVLDQLDRAADDADKAARAVERHDAELDAIRDHLAAADTTEPMRAVDVAGGLRAGRPTPYRRTAKGRHSA